MSAFVYIRPRTAALRISHHPHPSPLPVSRSKQQVRSITRRRIRGGTTTPVINDDGHPTQTESGLPFYFDTGYGLYAKRPSRPFPPPFLSPPSGSFSDPLSTHDRSRDRRPKVDGEIIRGITNGDDAVLVQANFIGANDGVGAWHQKPRGHAALWSRLILHFWALEAEKHWKRRGKGGGGGGGGGDGEGGKQKEEIQKQEDGGDGSGKADESSRGSGSNTTLDPALDLQRAYENTLRATSEPNEWHGTTTACAALLLHDEAGDQPLLYAINVGDSQIMVLRPSAVAAAAAAAESDSASASSSQSSSSSEEAQEQEQDGLIVYKSEGQWHWFDCPFQLGTNSLDTPCKDARVDTVRLEEGDVVIAMSDGVPDNLWAHEVAEKVVSSLREWEEKNQRKRANGGGDDLPASSVQYVAQELVEAARVIAEDPYAESPYMERAIEEGLPAEGGKLDDISVVVGICRRRNT